MSKRVLVRWPVIIGTTALLFGLLAAGGCAPNEFEDGVTVSVSEGDERGYAEVAVTIENDEITDVEITEYDGVGVEKLYEVYGQNFEYIEEAHEYFSEEIVEQNTWEVDTFSGATSTSEDIRQATRFALEKARVNEPEQEYFDGTFMARSEGSERGWHLAWVTLQDDEIVDVELAGTTPVEEDDEAVYDDAGRQVFELKGEDYHHEPYLEASEVIAEEVIEAQGPEVDTYTEATSSSEQWSEAVEKALEKARISPPAE